jgi:hypothetical protein
MPIFFGNNLGLTFLRKKKSYKRIAVQAPFGGKFTLRSLKFQVFRLGGPQRNFLTLTPLNFQHLSRNGRSYRHLLDILKTDPIPSIAKRVS